MSVFKHISKGLIVVFVLSAFFLTTPQKTSAYAGVADIVVDPTNLVQNTISAVADAKGILKDFVLDGIAWNITNMMIQKLTAQTVNWINTGFQGNPAYVTDPGKFFLGIGDSVASKFLSSTKFESLCSPFKAQIRLQLVKNYLSETDGENYSCTLSKVRDNYNNFVNDFDQGGWDGWFEVTQNSSNNPYGAYLNAKNDFDTQINSQIGKYQKQLDWGQGFLSFEKCLGTEYLDGATGKKECAGAKETVTPGSVIQTGLNKAMGASRDRLNVSTSINQIVGALLTQLVTKVLGGGSPNGLRGATQASPSDSQIRTLMDQLNQKTTELTPGINDPLPSEEDAVNKAAGVVGDAGTSSGTGTGQTGTGNTTGQNCEVYALQAPYASGDTTAILSAPSISLLPSSGQFRVANPSTGFSTSVLFTYTGKSTGPDGTPTLSGITTDIPVYLPNGSFTMFQANSSNTQLKYCPSSTTSNTVGTGNGVCILGCDSATPGTLGPTAVVSISPYFGQSGIPTYASGLVVPPAANGGMGAFTDPATPGSNTACMFTLNGELNSGTPNNPKWDPRMENMLMCGSCRLPSTSVCSGGSYNNCSFTASSTVYAQCP